MAIILFDNQFRKKLYPLTITKAVADLRIGIITIKERWEIKTNQAVFVSTEKYLQSLYPKFEEEDNIWIDASVLPNDELLDRILSLEIGDAIADEVGLIAGRNIKSNSTLLSSYENIFDGIVVRRIEYTWQMFQWNDEMIRSDFALLTHNKQSQRISQTNQIVYQNDIFIEEGATVEYGILNSSTGPIYIGKHAEVSEGSIIRGPFALGEHSLVKMGAKIYGATSIGPWCAVGGEIKNVIISGYSNKGHDGYLGDSVIGEWCNLGACTSNSNVKNSAADIKMWNAFDEKFYSVGIKCGVIMGDYSRTAINSSINTGSFIGAACSIFGNGLLPKIINNFTWGLNEKYDFDKAIRDINNWKKMKHQEISNAEIEVLKSIYELTV